jgi:hypothetical protein
LRKVIEMIHLEEFLSLRCAGDVLNAVGQVHCAEKEITEAMGVVTRIRKLVLAHPGEYTVVDLCAGNCLTSVLIAHLLPVKEVVAVDIRENKKLLPVNKLNYVQKNIYDADLITAINRGGKETDSKIIIVSVHACGELANRVVRIFNETRSDMLVLIPCCNGKIDNSRFKDFEIAVMTKYGAWTLQVAKKLQTDDVRIVKDENIISPRNFVIVAEKDGEAIGAD